MLENTYDATGYNFGILLTTCENLHNKMERIIRHIPEYQWEVSFGELLSNSNMKIIDFSEIDGLTINDLKNFPVFNNSVLIFIMYDEVELKNRSLHHSEEERYIKKTNISESEIFDLDSYKKDTQIDDMIVERLLGNINKKSNNYQRRAKCFLQRYKYGTKEKTDEKIKSMKK